MEGIARAFLAVSFFFELDGPLLRDGPFYICYGSILSRSPDSRALVARLSTSYPYAQFSNNGVSLGFISNDDICKLCGRYGKLVAFQVRHSSDRADIHLVFNRLFCRNISGLPQPIGWFVERQKLHARFGQPNHKSIFARSRQLDCDCQLQRHREIPACSTNNRKRRLAVRTRARSKRLRLQDTGLGEGASA